jgi:hypothetical protein
MCRVHVIDSRLSESYATCARLGARLACHSHSMRKVHHQGVTTPSSGQMAVTTASCAQLVTNTVCVMAHHGIAWSWMHGVALGAGREEQTPYSSSSAEHRRHAKTLSPLEDSIDDTLSVQHTQAAADSASAHYDNRGYLLL